MYFLRYSLLTSWTDANLSYVDVCIKSCIFFLIIYKLVSPCLSEWFWPEYKNLNAAKQREWHARNVSSLNALSVGLMCIYVLLYEDDVAKDPIWAKSSMVYVSVPIIMGYMLCDLLIIMFYTRGSSEICYVLHHLAVIYGGHFVAGYQVLPWFANFRLLSELSTPFVNQRWCLGALRHPKTSLSVIRNTKVTAASFFVVRIMTIPVYWYKVYAIHRTPTIEELGWFYWIFMSSSVILDIINVYWFAKMYKVIQMLTKLANHQSQTKTSDNKAPGDSTISGKKLYHLQ